MRSIDFRDKINYKEEKKGKLLSTFLGGNESDTIAVPGWHQWHRLLRRRTCAKSNETILYDSKIE